MEGLRILFLVLAFGFGFTIGEPCDSTTFDFPNPQQLSDYVAFNGSVPDLIAATVCVIVRATRAVRERALLSYAVDGQDKELLITFSENELLVTVKGVTTNHTVSPVDLDGRAFHFCVAFSAVEEQVTVFVDSEIISSQLYSGGQVIGGGNLIIGQEQISGQAFDSTKAFSGSLSNFYVWPRVLDDSEILEISYDCDCTGDYEINLIGSNVILHGDVTSQNETCPTFTSRACSFATFTLPAPDQTTDFVRYTGAFPELDKLTVCLWVDANTNRRGTAVLSYAADTDANELGLWFSPTDVVQITYRGSTYNFDDYAGSRAHICFTLETSTGNLVLYVDGIERQSVVASSRSPVKPEGFFVIGQDHDAVSLTSPKFESRQAYSGTVADLVIWPRVLSASAIYQVAVGCTCPSDDAIQFSSDNSETFGNAAASSSTPTHCANGADILDYEGCGLGRFDFTRSNQITDYIQVTTTLPELPEFSFCAWYSPANFDAATERAYLSYATTDESNALLLLERNNEVQAFANGVSHTFSVGRSLNNETHVCFMVSAITEEMQLYIDGVSVGSTSNTAGTILGGGILILGQDQDAVSTASGRNFQAAKAFSGTVKNPTFWKRLLTADEVSDIASRCVCPNDHVIVINENNVDLNGPVTYEQQTTCTTLTGDNECLTAPCHKYAGCTDNNSGYTCACHQDFADNGTSCNPTPPPPATPSIVNGSHILVQCTAAEIQLTLPVYIANHFHANLQTMHLRNSTCPPTLSPDNSTYLFKITGNLAGECATQVQRNLTHIIYTNEVRSIVDHSQPIFTGATFSIPFQCTFSTTGNIISINYTVEIPTATVSPSGGGGTFQFSSQLFADESFQNAQTQQTFATTDFLYVQIGIATEDPFLTTVLQRCWGTPTADLNDATQYDIIQSSCPVPDAIDNTVQIRSNGNSSKARFEAQIFAFTDGDVIYLHCEVSVCNSATDTCVPNCSPSARKRREISTKHKRQAETDVAYQTIGPFYREVPAVTPDVTANNSWLIGGILGGVVVILVAVLLIVAVRCYAGGRMIRDSKDKHILGGFNTFSNSMKGVGNPAMMT